MRYFSTRYFSCALVLATFAVSNFSVSVWADSSSLNLAEAINLSLQDTIKLTLRNNPQLKGYEFRTQALAGEKQTATLKPALRVNADLENIAGSGDYSGFDSGELTLALSSVIELGGQRDARLGLIDARQQQLQSQQRLLTLDLLTQVTQQFISLAAAQEQLRVLERTQQLALTHVQSLTKQVQAGRTPEAELLRANAAVARASIEVQKTRQQVQGERLQLAAFWAETQPKFAQAEADIFALPPASALNALLLKLDNNPDLASLSDEVFLRTAELRQAQAERKTNVEWSAGVRRLQSTDDSALVLGISVPLGTSGRSAGAMTTARANQAGAEQQRDSARIQLQAQLISNHGAYEQALAEFNALRKDVLPALEKATRATADGFNQGRYRFFELHLAQQELLDAQLALIEAATRAHLINTQIERLTGAALPMDTPHSDMKTLP